MAKGEDRAYSAGLGNQNGEVSSTSAVRSFVDHSGKETSSVCSINSSQESRNFSIRQTLPNMNDKPRRPPGEPASSRDYALSSKQPEPHGSHSREPSSAVAGDGRASAYQVDQGRAAAEGGGAHRDQPNDSDQEQRGQRVPPPDHRDERGSQEEGESPGLLSRPPADVTDRQLHHCSDGAGSDAGDLPPQHTGSQRHGGIREVRSSHLRRAQGAATGLLQLGQAYSRGRRRIPA